MIDPRAILILGAIYCVVISLPASPGAFVITSVGAETIEVFWL